jgi:hypothetical protein
MFSQNITRYIFNVNPLSPFFPLTFSLSAYLTSFYQIFMHISYKAKKTVFAKKAAFFAESLFDRIFDFLVSCGMIHVVSAAVLCGVLTGIAAAVLRSIPAAIPTAVLGIILAGIATAVLGTVLVRIPAAVLSLILVRIPAAVTLRIHGIGSVAVSAVVHIAVMIFHHASLLFGSVNLLRD